MGLVYAEITMTNLYDLGLFYRQFITKNQVRTLTTTCLVDTGAYKLVVPEHVKLQLGLTVLEQREVELADGNVSLCDVVGPIELRFANRMTVASAFVMGNEVLLGAIPMEDLDVVVDLKAQRLVVNPENPTMPKMKIKQHHLP
ncbi:MAG: clan AA aspartic protease [Nitrospirae bacterium]|nr:clan AA aspartic protease [Nitrospirota bacterium]